MGWWNRLSLKTKFTSAIALIVLVTVASVCLSYWSFTSLKDKSARLYQDMELDQLAQTLEIQHLQWVNTLSRYLVDPGARELNLATDPAQCGLGKWFYGTGKQEAISRIPSLADEAAALEAPHKALHATAVAIREMKEKSDDAGARGLFQSKTIPALQAVQKHLAGIRTLVADGVATQRQAFDKQATDSNRIIIALGLASMAALILLALILFRSILKPCQEIIQYSKKCREGSPEPLDLKRADELGQLAENLTGLTQHLHKELAFSKGVLEGITVPCAVFCPDDKTLFTNKQMVDLLEHDEAPEECLGLTSGELAWGKKGQETLSSKALKEKVLKHSQFEYTTHKGNGRHVMVTSAPLYDADEKLLGTIAVWIDVTDVVEKQNALEEKSRHIAEMAAQAQEVANTVSAASTALAQQVSASNQGALDQRDRMTETASAMTQMNATVLEVARSAGDAASLAEEASGTARSGAEAVSQVVNSITQVETYAGQLKTGMHHQHHQ